MTKPQIPEEPAFVEKVTSIQKILAGVALSVFLTVWVTGFDFVVNVFKPNFVIVLTYLRIGMASIGILITGMVGIQQIQNVFFWIIDNYEVYKRIKDYKKEKEKEK